MKIALLGYGKMGREIEKTALARNHEIVLTIDIDNQSDLQAGILQQADVAIDFSVPDSAYTHIMKCFEAGIPVVSGTTGWLDKYNEVSEFCRKNDKTFFYASNYSIGVNIFLEVNRYLAKLMDPYEAYDVHLEETHHIHKLDAPSGTAISIAEEILKNLHRKKNWQLEGERRSETLGITSIREGEVPGIHSVTYDSRVDTIEIRHTAKNRKGLALGAVLAAEFIIGKQGVFTMKDLMKV